MVAPFEVGIYIYLTYVGPRPRAFPLSVDENFQPNTLNIGYMTKVAQNKTITQSNFLKQR